MEYRKVTAIVRHYAREAVEERLLHEGVRGLSVMPVHGCGESVDVFSREGVRHCRIEVFTSAERADAIAQAIAEAAHSGVAGDGLVAIEPVLRIIRVKTGHDASLPELHH